MQEWGAGACSPVERSPSGAFLAPDCQRPAEIQVSCECTMVRRVYVSALDSSGFLSCVGMSTGETWAASSCLLGSAAPQQGPC